MINYFTDVETTGFDIWRNSIISLCFIVDDGNTTHEFHEYAKPESMKFWGAEAQEIHGIHPIFANRQQEQSELCGKLIKFLEPFGKNILWYHGNKKFDYWFIEAMFHKQGMLHDWWKFADVKKCNSTIQLAKHKLQLQNYKLNTVCDALDIELNHHDAVSDTRACYEIWKRLK